MKKIFTLAAAVLASFSLWAATETHPSSAESSTDVVGTSYTIPGTYIAGVGGTKAGDMQTKGIKFRLSNKVDDNAKGFVFNVNEGYKITEIAFCGHCNDGSKTSSLTELKVDGVPANFTPVELPTKTSSISFTLNGFEAFENVILVFEGTGTQANLEYTVTYEEAVQKEVDHVVETLTGAAINGVALDETEMSTLLNNEEFEDLAFYVEAPTVTFTVQTDTYYVGEETPSTKSEGIDVVAELVAGMWMAQLTVNNETTYTIRAAKPETRTITFMNGETVLGTEVVAQGETSTKYAEFEVLPLAKFEGWFRNSDFTSQIDIETYAINEDQTLYGKFVKAYAQSLNIEQLVLDNGKGADIDSLLLARGYEFANIDQLDSLNDEKDNRNYPYLGLKLKKEGAYVGFNLQAANDLAILRFGQISEPFVIEKNGDIDTINAQVANLTPESNQTVIYNDDNIDLHIRIRTLSGKTLVIKQIMINEEIATVTLPGAPAPQNYTISIAEGIVNGTVAADYATAEEGDLITLTVTPAEGYKVEAVKYNDGEDHAIEAVEGVYSFTMPAANVTVSATFVEDGEPIEPQPETYTITVNAGEHGTASAPVSESRANERIVLTITPDEGYRVDEVRVNGVGLMPENGVYSFTMPAQAVTVDVTFEPENEGIEDVNAAKAVKRLEKGMLLIEKNGKMFNVLGARIK